MRYKIGLCILLFVGIVTTLNAQIKTDEDTTTVAHENIVKSVVDYAEETIFQYIQKSAQTSSEKKFEFSIIGGPYYTNETKVGLGIIGSGLFRLRGCEQDSVPSNVSLYTNVTTSGAYAVGLRGNIYFPQKRYWIDADFSFSDTPLRYWGIGYAAGENTYYTNYNLQEIEIKLNFFKKLGTHTYAGLITKTIDSRGIHFDNIALLDGRNNKTSAAGIGLNWSYDSRDVIANPYRGMYIKLENVFYPNALSNTSGFNKTEVEFRTYKELREGTILAFEFCGHINNGDVPWNLLALVGNPSQMRGYYTGRYRDKNLLESQLELRQHIYKRSGMVVWVGGGNAFPQFKDIKLDETLPTVGLGYRFRLKDRTNLRFDYGIGKGQSAFYININEAF